MSKNPWTYVRVLSGPGRPSSRPAVVQGRNGKELAPKPEMDEMKESDTVIVATKAANNGERSPAEQLERRTVPKGKPENPHTYQAQNWERVSQGMDWLRQFVKRNPQERLITLLHHVNVDSLRAAFYALKRDAAAGADGVTWQEYADGLENRLVDLCERVHRGAYRAPPLPAGILYLPTTRFRDAY